MSKTFAVSFIKTIEVEAEDMDEALDIAKDKIDFYWDEIEVEEIDESTPVWDDEDDLESLGIGQYRGLED